MRVAVPNTVANATTSAGAPGVNRPVVAAALAVLAVLGSASYRAAGTEMIALLAIGAGLGIALYHAGFGFTGSWRKFLVQQKGAGLRWQMVMIALTASAFLPLFAQGSVFGQPVSGAIAPVGVSVIVGAFLFGIGMQVGGACASGTLFTTGSGNTRMIATLIFFVAGSLLGTLHMPWWLDRPGLGGVSLQGMFGVWPAIGLTWAICGAVALSSVWSERRAYGHLAGDEAPPRPAWRRAFQGPWPLAAAALVLAALNLATLTISGSPWSVSFGYALWGAQAASALGLDVASWPFWTWEGPRAALAGGVFANAASVMNFGIVAGALLGAGLAGRFAPTRHVPWKLLLASAIGGMLMGYGARLAFGCNIGALFSGIASGSLHGWLWLVCALLGNWAGIHVRPLFGMART